MLDFIPEPAPSALPLCPNSEQQQLFRDVVSFQVPVLCFFISNLLQKMGKKPSTKPSEAPSAL